VEILRPVATHIVLDVDAGSAQPRRSPELLRVEQKEEEGSFRESCL
jgi:hypothetical protein